MIITDILSFIISDFNDTFIKAIVQNGIIFKSQYALESLASKDPGYAFNLAHGNDNKVTGIIWMTSYMRDKFERFGNFISIDIMHSSVCNAKEFCYISPIITNEVGKINVVCEGFVISEIHDAYTFVLDSLFKICPLRNKNQVYAIFSDEFMTKPILDSIDMYDTFIFYYYFHLKMNLEKLIVED